MTLTLFAFFGGVVVGSVGWLVAILWWLCDVEV